MNTENHIGLKVRKLNNKLLNNETISTKIAGLTRIQGRILYYILSKNKEGSCFQKNIEEKFSIRASSATEIINKLVNKGYVIRKDYPKDKRLKELIITEEGILKKNEICNRIKKSEQIYREGIEEDKLEIFLRL